MTTPEDVISTLSKRGDLLINVGDVINTLGGVQYTEGIFWVHWGDSKMRDILISCLTA